MTELLIATNNRGKLAELARLLDGLPIMLRDPSYFGMTEGVEETGATFAENAAIKAAFYAGRSGVPALADDSGLVVDHLEGAPGVRSARYAGSNANDADRIEKVLSKITGSLDRSARFVCVCALADAGGNIVHVTEGTCEGSISVTPRGSNGFGYDPIFLPEGYDQTFGELTSDIKHSISHRARAVKKMIPFLRGFLKI